ncbi:MAG: type III PLP-dependent enzyme [Candidatus Desulfofervidus auxilii]|nr:type III PLP-dependent enzyme [Candidatus Desulfofervidus auxilii]
MVKKFKIEAWHRKIVTKRTLLKVLSFIDHNPDISTPVLLMDEEKIAENVSLIGKNIQNSKVFYAVKANSDEKILKLLKNHKIGFEIASEGELDLLINLNINPDLIISSNPIKSINFIKKAYSYGVKFFAFDSFTELEKLDKYAPGCNVYVRISVPNEGSEWPLSKKFGVELDEAFELLKRAKELNLNPIGITFHVGSQCLNLYNWYIAIDKARQLWERAIENKIELKVLNIGGGYPINYTKIAPKINEIEQYVAKLLKEKIPGDFEVHIEPGRAVIGDAGIMVTKILGKAVRNYENWLYLDVGVFNGLMESLGGIKYTYIVEVKSDKCKYKKWTVAGPSCDSMDVIDKHVDLPDVEEGSLVLILSAGAYTVSYASEFNGFPIPKVILI